MWALTGGVIALIIGILLLFPWGRMTWEFIAGGIVVLLFLGGLVAIASGISDIKDQVAEKKEKEKEKAESGSSPEAEPGKEYPEVSVEPEKKETSAGSGGKSEEKKEKKEG